METIRISPNGPLPMSTLIFRFQLIPLLLLLIAGNVFIMFLQPGLRFDAIVIHHSASMHDNYESIKRYHRTERGWRDAAYHLILSNGSTKEVPLGYLEATERYGALRNSRATRSGWCNANAVHLCIVGNYEEQAFPVELRAPLAHALYLLQSRFGIPDERILFHGQDCSPTACPGKHLDKMSLLQWIHDEKLNVSEDIRRQQRAVLNKAGNGLFTVIFPVMYSTAIIAMWFYLFRHRFRKHVF